MDFQSTLLNYFVQQGVSHGAMLFAAVIATFYFFNIVSKRREETRKSGRRGLSVAIFSWLLVGGCIFMLGRIAVYGMLSQSTIYTAPEAYQKLSAYYENVQRGIQNMTRLHQLVYQIYTDGFAKWVASMLLGLLFGSWLLWTLDLIDFKEIFYNCPRDLGKGHEPSQEVQYSEEEKKRIIWKDKDVQINLFFGDYPYALGHIVVQPTNCEEDLSKLTEKHWEILSKWIPQLAIAMRKVLKEVSGREVKKIYLCSFNESTDYPVHFHLVPRYERETLRGDGLLSHRAQEKLMISRQQRDKIVNAIKKELESKQPTQQ